MVRIAVVVTARPSWAKLFTICEALQAMPDVDLQIIACASALLERYGNVSKVIQAQGFTLAAECWSTYEGANLVTSVKETGALVSELGTAVIRLGPACVVVCADRHEVLAAAIAGSYQHISKAANELAASMTAFGIQLHLSQISIFPAPSKRRSGSTD
jgi:UDP-N-acetylglucosamine 2-epimerase